MRQSRNISTISPATSVGGTLVTRPYQRSIWIAALVLIVCLVGKSSAWGASPSMLKLTTDRTTLVGKLVAMDKSRCWFVERDGRLHRLQVSSIKKVSKVGMKFDYFSAAEMRDQLRREFSGEMEVAGTTHYLVCAQPGHADAFADMFESVYRAMHRQFSPRGFSARGLDVPLVAVVFRNRAKFAEYCRKDGVRVVDGLRGYYLRTSNRVALYDDRAAAAGKVSGTIQPTPCHKGQCKIRNAAPTISASLSETIIHEGTHQVAFNIGLHSRIGESPRWVVEGLATMFEAPGIRSRGASKTSEKLNRERFVWFGNYSQERRTSKSLEEFIANDNLFHTATLDAYSQSWALSLFLLETRPSAYTKYLRRISNRDPFAAYSREERLADFRAEFGDDLKWLDVKFMRFMDSLR